MSTLYSRMALSYISEIVNDFIKFSKLMYSYSRDKTSCLWKAARFVSGRYNRSFERKKGKQFW